MDVRGHSQKTSYEVLEKYLKEDSFLCKFGSKGGTVSFMAAYFKATQMKSSLLSPAMIEAVLTIIIERINNESMTDDEQYEVIKQIPFTLSYTDDDETRMKGVRVFKVKAKNASETQWQFVFVMIRKDWQSFFYNQLFLIKIIASMRMIIFEKWWDFE